MARLESPCATNATMPQPKSRLEAMRIQELYYKCTDYTGIGSGSKKRRQSLITRETSTSPNSATPEMVHLLLDECASLVTDPLTLISSKLDERSTQLKKRDWSPNSPLSVIPDPEQDGSASQSQVNPVSSASSSQEFGNISSDFMKEPPSTTGPSAQAKNLEEESFVTSNPHMLQWRLEMFDWACIVVDHSHFDRSAVLATAFNLLDRYTAHEMNRQNSPPVTRQDYHLFAITALYIAVKVLAPFPQKMGLDAFSLMSREFYQPQDIAATELDMLRALRWRTTPPTAIGFCRELAECLLPNSEDRRLDMEQIYPTICDVSVSVPSFLSFSTSVIAAAALLHAARLTGQPRREQIGLRKSAEKALGLGNHDTSELVALEVAYKKIEQLYC